PAAARSALGLKGLTVPFRNMMPVAPNASAARAMVPAFPGSCKPSSTTTRLRPRNNCGRFQTGGWTSAITPWLASVPDIYGKSWSGTTATRMPVRRLTWLSTADCTDSEHSTTLTAQPLRRASSSRWKVSATRQPSCVRSPRAMARRTSLTSGLAALEIVSGLGILQCVWDKNSADETHRMECGGGGVLSGDARDVLDFDQNRAAGGARRGAAGGRDPCFGR